MESARASGNEAARDPVHHAARTRSTRLVHCRCLARRSGRSSGNRGSQRTAIVWPDGPPMKSPKPIIGERLGGEPQNEQEHFIQCPDCGRWIDMRNLGEVLEHEWTCDKSRAG